MAQSFRFRRGTAAQWTAANPVLAQGEPGYATDTHAYKIGDGSSTWSALPDIVADVVGPVGQAATVATGLRASLDAGATTGFAVLGDSTGNETTEWAYLFAADIAAAHPEYTVQHVLWSDASQNALTPSRLQFGTAGEAYLDSGTGSTTRSLPLSESPHTPAVIDVRAKIRMDDWTPASIATVVAREGGSGLRSWYFGVAPTSGKLAFYYSADGTGLVTDRLSSVAPTVADGAVLWIRAVFTPSTTLKYYTSSDGNTWTQLGSDVTIADTPALGAAFNAAQPYELGGRQTSLSYTGLDIYHIDIRDGLDGKPIVPLTPAAWGAAASTAAQITGAPTFTVVNGSHPGADIAYWTQSRIEKALPAYGQRLGFLSLSHNELAQSGPTFASRYAATLAAMTARMPGVPLIGLTQNPQKSPRAAGFIEAQAIRRMDILSATSAAGATVIDTYQAFVDAGISTTVSNSDGVHPTTTGSQVWRDTVAAAVSL